MRRGPLAGRYSAVAAMVMFALIPYLALSAALEPLTPIIAKQLHTSLQTMSLSSGLGNAAYAVGTVLAVQFAQHLPQRRMMVIYAVLARHRIGAGGIGGRMRRCSSLGHVIQGLCTSLLLIAAVPPLAIGYPANKLRDTAVIMNMCIFGAVALGPFIGGLQAESNAWRPLFWIIAAISAVALILTLLTFDDAPPANPDAPRDPLAIASGGRRLRGRLLRCLRADEPRLLGPHRDRAAVGRSRNGRRARHLSVPRQAAAPDRPAAAHQFDTGCRYRRGAVCGRGIGLGDRAHLRRFGRALQSASYRVALPARGRRRGDFGGGARAGHPEACHALPPVRRHDLARGRYRRLPHRSALQPGY